MYGINNNNHHHNNGDNDFIYKAPFKKTVTKCFIFKARNKSNLFKNINVNQDK